MSKLNANSIELGSLTTTQRNALSGVVNGTTIYNSTTESIEAYGPDGWKTVKTLGTTPVTITFWGAGGGNGNQGPCGGGSAYPGGAGHSGVATGNFSSGSTLSIYVGGGGGNRCGGSGGPNGGRPGSGGNGGPKCGGGGGGATSVYLDGNYSSGTLLVVGGAGGGAGGGVGGVGGYPSSPGPFGGTQTAGGDNPGNPGYGGASAGTDGSSFQGGPGGGGGGGGSGYFGGAGATGDNGDCNGGAGGGGSGYFNPTYFPPTSITSYQSPNGSAANSSNPHYTGTVGRGAPTGAASGSGYVVITDPSGSTTFSYTNSEQTYTIP